jgi:hypothetical protein|tara:strand:- start:1285 stop:1491 length:207 start_codon:yes stop_codon:yes gene_type:complete
MGRMDKIIYNIGIGVLVLIGLSIGIGIVKGIIWLVVALLGAIFFSPLWTGIGLIVFLVVMFLIPNRKK